MQTFAHLHHAGQVGPAARRRVKLEPFDAVINPATSLEVGKLIT